MTMPPVFGALKTNLNHERFLNKCREGVEIEMDLKMIYWKCLTGKPVFCLSDVNAEITAFYLKNVNIE